MHHLEKTGRVVMSNTAERVNILESQVLSHDWYLLRKITFDYQRNNGEWQRQTREVYDRGNGAAILLYNREKKTVVLTRQFRLPVFVNGHDGLLIEVAAGCWKVLRRKNAFVPKRKKKPVTACTTCSRCSRPS
jgi:hypothetical protein